jgi:glycosyltransferase involved in cell wall biosynthesis
MMRIECCKKFVKKRAIFFDFTINYGGAIQGTVSLASRLDEVFDVHIVDVYGISKEYIKNVKKNNLCMHVIYAESKKTSIGHKGNFLKRFFFGSLQILDFYKIRKRLVSQIQSIKPDIVWVNNEKSLVFILGVFLKTDFPVIFYMRGWATGDQVSPLLKFLLKYRVKYILAHAKASIDQLMLLGIPSEKIFYTPNAVEIVVDAIQSKRFPPDLPGLGKPLKILLPAARPVKEKGHLVAVKALRLLVDRGLDAILWLPGKTPTGVGQEFMQELTELIATLRLADRIFFIGWREDIQSVIANADVVILPSHTEGFPRVVIESMFLGTPVLATPVGGIPEAIIDGQTGFLVDIDNEQMLAEKIEFMIKNPSFRDDLVKNAFEFASNTFVPEVQTEIVKNTFYKAMAQ